MSHPSHHVCLPATISTSTAQLLDIVSLVLLYDLWIMFSPTLHSLFYNFTFDLFFSLFNVLFTEIIRYKRHMIIIAFLLMRPPSDLLFANTFCGSIHLFCVVQSKIHGIPTRHTTVLPTLPVASHLRPSPPPGKVSRVGGAVPAPHPLRLLRFIPNPSTPCHYSLCDIYVEINAKIELHVQSFMTSGPVSR